MTQQWGTNEKIISASSAHITFSVLLQRKKVICFMLVFALVWL